MAFFGKLGRTFVEKAGSNALRSSLGQNGAAAGAAPALFLVQSRGMASTASSKLFIGGLSWSMDEATLRAAFASFGEVKDVRIITDRETGRSRGFGFVSFTSDEEAQTALQEMDGRDLSGRTIRVDYATDRTAEGGGGGGSFSRGGGFGGGYSQRGPPRQGGGAPGGDGGYKTGF